MDNIEEIVTNFLHEVSLVLPNESAEYRIIWCYKQCKKYLADKDYDILRTNFKLTDNVDCIKYYLEKLWVQLFKIYTTIIVPEEEPVVEIPIPITVDESEVANFFRSGRAHV